MQKLFSTVLLALVVLAGNALAQTFSLKYTFQNPNPDPDDQFGFAVAVAGSRVLVGAPRDDAGATDTGVAYVFDANTGARLLTINNPSPDVNDQFGAAVAAVGSNFIVGAPGANSSTGEAYLFDGNTGARLQTFSNPGGGAGQFGIAVAGFGSYALIGAPLNSSGAGTAYLFDANSGAPLQTFTNPTSASGDQFGRAVAGFGNYVLVGAPFDDNSGRTDTGAAHLFDATTGAFIRTFLNPTAANLDQFGGAVAGVGNSVFVGAAFDDASFNNSGFAYRFDATTGAKLNDIANPSPATADQFAFSVFAFDSSVLIGALGANIAAGEAYLFDANSGGLQQPPLSNPTPADNESFGRAVAAAGNNIAIGAPNAESMVDGEIGPGAVYLFSSNRPPVADAGADQTVESTSPVGTSVTLDGSGSSDADNDQLTYTWRENGNIIAGPTMSTTSTVTLGLGSHTIELTVEDGKGGTDTDVVVINIVDTTSPNITLNGANPLTLECHVDAYTEPGAVVNDAGDPSPALVITGSVDVNAVGTYTITYTATDASGNSASTTRTVNVVDTTPPTVTLNGMNPMTVECHGTYVEPSAAVSDGCDSAPTLVISGNVNMNAGGTYTVTYTATDASGNSASATRTVNVSDHAAPEITLNGANPLTLECHATYTEPGAQVSDACDPAPSLVISSSVNANAVGTYTLTYTATDAGGNSATKTRTVNVVDTMPPTITLNGDNPLTLACHAAYTEPGAVVGDACDESPALTITGNVNANAIGTYTVTYTAADAHGNSATKTRTVNVTDTTPPTITLNGANPMTVECHTAYNEPGATVNDACDSSPTLSITGSVNANVIGTYTITYTASDASGNNSAATTRTVNVVDTTPPAITLKSPIVITYADHYYTTITISQCVAAVNDACGGSIAISEVRITSATSDEPENAYGYDDGYTTKDIVIASDCKSVQVRKERADSGDGRVYTINLKVHDASGNVAAAAFKVLVPLSPYCGTAVNSGPHYTVTSSCAGMFAKAAGDGEVGDTAELDSAEPVIPEGYEVYQNYPNPFNPTTEIRFALPEASHVTVKIFNTLGETIRTLADQDFAAGTHAVNWNAQNERGQKVPSGLYFYQVVTPNFTATKRMILAK